MWAVTMLSPVTGKPPLLGLFCYSMLSAELTETPSVSAIHGQVSQISQLVRNEMIIDYSGAKQTKSVTGTLYNK